MSLVEAGFGKQAAIRYCCRRSAERLPFWQTPVSIAAWDAFPPAAFL
jgi:hypothetical protein